MTERQMPNSDFDEGFNLFYDEFAPRLGDIGSISANQLDGTYLSSIKETIDSLNSSVNSFQDNNNPQLFGLVLEAVEAGSFNVDAAGKRTGESAWRVGSNKLGSVDIATSWNEDYGLKFYKSAYGSTHAQTRSIEHEYLSYLRDFKRRNPEEKAPSPKEYLISKGMDPDTDMSRALYSGQTLLCPPEQGAKILSIVSEKIQQLSEAGDTTGTLERYRKKSFYWYKDIIASNGEKLK